MADKPTPEPRQSGTSGQRKSEIATPSIPDPQTKARPLTDDEKVDEASLESMDASDPPSFNPGHTGAPPKNRTPKD